MYDNSIILNNPTPGNLPEDEGHGKSTSPPFCAQAGKGRTT